MDSAHWWQADKDQAHKGVTEVLERLSGDIEDRDRMWRRFLSIFMNKAIAGFHGEKLSEDDQFRSAFSMEKRLGLNPAENCITTLGSRISSQRPRASFVVSTDGPNAWDQKVKAEAMEKGVAGEWQRNRFFQQSVKVFQYAGAVGFGAMKHWPDQENRRVVIEATPPWELVVDESSAMTTPPRSLYHRMYLPADVLKAMFPNRQGPGGKVSDVIDQQLGRTSGLAALPGFVRSEDLVQVIEAWHLPAGKVKRGAKLRSSDAKGGRHSIVIDGCTLLDDAWCYERFPFAWFRWGEPLIGWYPQGLIEKHESVQQQINKLLQRIQEAAHLHATSVTFYEDGAINKKDLKNVPGTLIKTKKGAAMPKTTMPLSIPSELIRFVWDLYGRYFEGTGVSQMSAASVKPAGIESGKGLLVLKDSESGRHATLNDQWDDMHMESADLTVQCAEELQGSGGGYITKYVNQRKLEVFDWKDKLERDVYEIAVFPSSMMPHEPAGRIERAEQLMAAGMMSKEQARAQVFRGYPDMEQLGSLEAAQYEDILMQISQMLVHGEDVEPMPRQALQLGVEMMTSAYLRGRQQGAPEEKLRLVLDWIDRAEAMLEEAAAAQAAMAAEAQQPPGPPGQPGVPGPEQLPPGPPEGPGPPLEGM